MSDVTEICLTAIVITGMICATFLISKSEVVGLIKLIVEAERKNENV